MNVQNDYTSRVFFFFYVQPISMSIETIGMLVDHY